MLLKRKGNLQLPTGEQGQTGQKERRGECEGIRERAQELRLFHSAGGEEERKRATVARGEKDTVFGAGPKTFRRQSRVRR